MVRTKTTALWALSLVFAIAVAPGLAAAGQELTNSNAAPIYAGLLASDVKIDMARLDTLPKASGDGEWQCLAEALYFEARGESVKGQMAVAEVILNRVNSRKFPNSVCGVVHQGGTERNSCQFSYHCDGRREVFAEGKAYERVGKIAELMLAGRERSLTDGALYFHTDGVRPRWARRMALTAEIGTHIFYAAPTRLTSN